jgi:protein-S-isoprenylcysteine O-methyltransferase Ste14
MQSTTFVASLCALGAIAVLPVVFFKSDGKFNVRWWLTGMPFIVSGCTLIAAQLGLTRSLAPAHSATLEPIAVALSMLAMSITSWTVGCHRIPLALWHQESDAPACIVTWGPYRHVRHPFYVSFLLAQVACVLALPHPGTVFGLLYATVALSMTARREEQRLLASSFGEEYRSYMGRTGRLVPWVGGRVA